MRRFRSVDVWAKWMFAALGVLAPACSGDTEAPTGNAYPCKNPQPFSVDGQATGLEMCDGSVLRRSENITCPSALPQSEACSAQQMNCTTDADCTDHAHGFCRTDAFSPGSPTSCSCEYGCVVDSECPDGQRCLCGNPVGRCVAADCGSSADCPSGFDCIVAGGSCSLVNTSLHCQGPADKCFSRADCSATEYCGVGPQGNLVCKPDGCAGIGRPFLVDGAARTAAAVPSQEYLVPSSPRLTGLAPRELAALANHWTTVGLMEHASIAAFARFSLQLLGLGAPRELLEASGAAQLDETRHAASAFSLASAYAGKPVGPGPLELSGALVSIDPRQVLADTIREGCIGETLAAVEAGHAAEHARDPFVESVLSGIAADEGRHAQLAWRFVAWLLAKHPELHGFARDEFALGIAEARRGTLAPSHDRAKRELELGIVAGQEREQLHQDVLERVVGTCAEAMLGESPRGRVNRPSRAHPVRTGV